MPHNTALPKKGLNKQQIKDQLTSLKSNDADWRNGRTFSLVFYPGDEAIEVAKHAYNEYFCENALNPTAFPSLRKMEQDCVCMTANLLNGDKHTAGVMTSGGTESLLLAVKAARDWGRKQGITEPEIVAPITAHPAFNKACEYFGVKLVSTPVDSQSAALVSEMQNAITGNTVLLVGSAPQYPHGIIDPITDIAALASKNKILCHVDACIGGFILPFIEEITGDIPQWDFRVPGVTSISCDLHKYAYAAKGASVILYKNAELRRFQYTVATEWPGGIYASPSIAGTRPGGAIAAAWAVMKFLGYDGYLEIARRTVASTQRIISGIEKLSADIQIIGKPKTSIIAFKSDSLDVFTIADEMQQTGWMTDRQHQPNSLHLTISQAHSGREDEFLSDLNTAVTNTKNANIRGYSQKLQVAASSGLCKILPNGSIGKINKMLDLVSQNVVPKRSAALYGMLANLPERGELKDLVSDALDKINSPH